MVFCLYSMFKSSLCLSQCFSAKFVFFGLTLIPLHHTARPLPFHKSLSQSLSLICSPIFLGLLFTILVFSGFSSTVRRLHSVVRLLSFQIYLLNYRLSKKFKLLGYGKFNHLTTYF